MDEPNTTAVKAVKNKVQFLTKEEQETLFFAVVASNFRMASGEHQNPERMMVRMRNGEYVYIKDLPPIDPASPQPNGDYSVSLIGRHTDSYNETKQKAGEGWLWLGDDGLVHMAIKLSYTSAGFDVWPMLQDKSAKFSTQGVRDPETDGGVWRDSLVVAVAVVIEGNDPSTQVEQYALVPMEETASELKEFVPFAANFVAEDAPVTEGESVETAEDVAETKTAEEVVAEEETIEKEAAREEDPVTDNTDGAEAPESEEVEMGDTATTPVVPEANALPEQPIATAEDAKVDNKTWLSTENAFEAFTDALSKGSQSAFDAAWGGALTENGITFDPDNISLLPELLVTELNEIITTRGEIYNKLSHTGLMYYVVAAVDTLESAKVRAPRNRAAKVSQEITAKPRVLIPTAIYKLFSEAYAVIAQNGGLTGAIVQLVVRELAMKVLELIERAVIIGGVTDDKGAAITNFITPVAADTVAGGTYGDVYVRGAEESVPEAITKAASMILSGGSVTLITTRANAAMLPYMTVGSSEIPLFLNGAERGSINIPMVTDVIAPIWLTEADLNGAFGFLVDLSAYRTVGDAGISSFYQFYMRTNEHDFEAVKMFGGALAKQKAAVKLTITAGAEPAAQSAGVEVNPGWDGTEGLGLE